MNYDLNKADVGDVRPSSLDFKNPLMDTDGVSSQEETTWDNNNWTEYFGDYSNDPHLKNSISQRATWLWGRGWSCDDLTKIRFANFNGWGKDTAQDIFNNMEITACINGDSYGEIIWNDPEKRDFAINVKPLNPGTIRHVINPQGILKRYEQTARIGDFNKTIRKFDPQDILHFSIDRVADQVHGTSLIPALKKIINASGQIFDDLQQIMHREAKPVILFKLKTDNEQKIAQFKDKVQKAMRMATDNIMFIPDDENVLSYEVLKINPPSPILIEWKNAVRKDFYSTIGAPELLSDSSGSTETGGKVGILAFQQVVEKRQREREAQIEKQLKYKIDIYPPESIQQDLSTDQAKDGNQQLAFQPQDVQGGRNS